MTVIEHKASPGAAIVGPASKPNKAIRGRRQMLALLAAEAVQTKSDWKHLLPKAEAAWPKLSRENLSKVEGNHHKLAGLIQLHYQLGRSESDQQVSDFFKLHTQAV